MRLGLRTQMTVTITMIVLLTVALISLLANIFIKLEFEDYAKKQQNARSEDIVTNLSHPYNRINGEWDLSYVHGVGMYALYEGYVICLYDKDGTVIWDAENHDMSLCNQIMTKIETRMEEMRPNLNGGFSTKEYELAWDGQKVGRVAIRSYGPYFLNENDFGFLHSLNLILFFTGTLSLLFSVIAGWILARRISRPITKTMRIATQISDGNYEVRFEGTTKAKELDELAKAMNHMAASLENQERLRKRLTGDVAHELRTPLSAVASHLEMMLEDVWKPTPERLKGCYEEIGRIAGLVSELERLAQLESDNLRLKMEKVSLLELAFKVSGNFESETVKKGIKLSVEGDEAVILSDRDRIHQVVTNLLSNAVKYTPEGGSIRVLVRDTPQNGILTVEDDGIGISEEELPLIYERFYRTDKSRDRRTGGAGIGLTIAKSIVTALGGRITAESELNRGSRFTISLPKSP